MDENTMLKIKDQSAYLTEQAKERDHLYRRIRWAFFWKRRFMKRATSVKHEDFEALLTSWLFECGITSVEFGDYAYGDVGAFEIGQRHYGYYYRFYIDLDLDLNATVHVTHEVNLPTK